MVPFGRNPKSALSEQRLSDQQMGGEQQDECRPRRAEEMIGSVHCLMIFYVIINVLSDNYLYLCTQTPKMLGL